MLPLPALRPCPKASPAAPKHGMIGVLVAAMHVMIVVLDHPHLVLRRARRAAPDFGAIQICPVEAGAQSPVTIIEVHGI